MKKIFVLLLMFTLFVAVSCDDDEGGVGGGVRLQDLDSYQIHPKVDDAEVNVTDLAEYRKDDVRIFGKFASVLSESNFGWSAYRWTSDLDAAGGVTDPATDATDCDGAYKVSYFERASENVHRFVGGGMCLDSGNNNNTDDRVENLRALVNEVMEHSLTGINRLTGTDDLVDANIVLVCDSYDRFSIDNVVTEGGVTLNDENDELYLFIAEVAEADASASMDEEEMSGFSVTVKCHPDTELVDRDVYGLTDDSGNVFIKEVVDELADLDPANDQALIDEGVWNVYTFPKLGEDETLNDPPKLSYFRISGEVGDNNRRFIVGAGIYLDAGNSNITDPINKLEEIRNRVRGAAALLLAEAKENEGLLGGMFFENDAADSDADDFYSQFIMPTTPIPAQEYIFVWENR